MKTMVQAPGAVRVVRLWEAATCPDATPARLYLSRCGCWPWPGRHVRVPLPESVRWLAREAAPERDSAAGWHGLPPGAAGAVVFAWRRSGGQDGAPVAVTLVALDARGYPVPEARSAVGSCAGAMFRAGNRGDEWALEVRANDDGRPYEVTEASPLTGLSEVLWLEVLGGKQRSLSVRAVHLVFTRAVWGNDKKLAATLLRAELPEDAAEADREHWRKLRSLYFRDSA